MKKWVPTLLCCRRLFGNHRPQKGGRSLLNVWKVIFDNVLVWVPVLLMFAPILVKRLFDKKK
ncbi:hypothetical protein O3V59_13150 [Brevibacillus thermoruber]|uniref:Uncharacterized protein n=1 Tax=Brevibacillus thermoruber TaxID=33942 RepID=A0A9X3TSY7_9BACL|nr:hypothetical protein [Brevibacillus thermoruber]MDA5109313.1 hypothetical protein [Brevibacillus thermoruber]